MAAIARQYALNIGLAQQAFDVSRPYSAPFGAKQVLMACASYPSAGTVTLEYRVDGDATWRKVPKATAIPLTGPLVFYSYGPIATYRATLNGVVGGSGLVAWVTDIDAEGFPPLAFEGLRALTTQNYTEANVKNGVQYEASALNLAVPASPAAGSNIDIIVTTGLKPVLIKLRSIDFNGLKMEARVYKDPAFSGGTIVPYFNMNLRNPVPGTIVAKANGPTPLVITSVGTECAAATYGMGSTGQGQTVLGTYKVSGIERLLAPSTSYLLRITNTSASPQDIATYLSWYEGDTDLPL